MATDFSYNDKTIISNGPIKPSGVNQPLDPRTEVKIYADIESIPSPYVGMIITVLQDETNSNKMTDYKVLSLKANSLGVANSVVDQVQRYADYLGVSGQVADTNNFATKEELGLKADKTELHSHINKTVLDGITSTNVDNWNNKVDKVEGKTLTTNDYTNEEKQTVASLKATVGDTSSGLVKDVKDLKTNGISQDNINVAIENYLTEHPVQSGATTEQVAQIEANRVAIGDANSGLTKEVNNIKNTELQNLNTAIQTLETLVGVDETVGDKSGLPSGDANVIASINRIDRKTTAGNGLTTEQEQQLATAYEHSQSTHVQVSDIPTRVSKLENDSSFVTTSELNTAISRIEISGGTGISYTSVNVSTDTFVIYKPGFILSSTSTTINEGSSTTFTVKLEEAPSEDITVTLTSNNGNITVSPSTLTFTSANYSDAQTVTVNTVEALDYIDWSGNIIVSSVGYNNATFTVNCKNISVNYGNIVTSLSSLTILEGNSGTFTVKLGSQPTQNQTVSLSSNNTDVTLSPGALTFTPSNYNTPQIVTVAAAEDSDETNDSATITLTSSNVSNVTVSVTVNDNDVTVYGEMSLSTTSLTINEGSSGTFTVQLASQPTVTEVISIVSNDTNITVSPTSLTFEPSTYNTPQTVTATVSEKSDTEDWTGTLTLTSDNISSKTINISVKNTTEIPLTGISIDATAEVMEGKSITLTPVLTPSNATLNELTWTANNKNVTVKNGVITGITAGESIVTVSSTNNSNITASCTVTITEAVVEPIMWHFDAQQQNNTNRASMFGLSDLNGSDIVLKNTLYSAGSNKQDVYDIESHWVDGAYIINDNASYCKQDDLTTLSPLFDKDFTIQINYLLLNNSSGNVLWLGTYSNYTCCLSVRKNRVKMGDTNLNTSTLSTTEQVQLIITYEKLTNSMKIWVNGTQEYNSVLPRTLDTLESFGVGTGRLDGNAQLKLYSLRIYNYVISDEVASELYTNESVIEGRV